MNMHEIEEELKHVLGSNLSYDRLYDMVFWHLNQPLGVEKKKITKDDRMCIYEASRT